MTITKSVLFVTIALLLTIAMTSPASAAERLTSTDTIPAAPEVGTATKAGSFGRKDFGIVDILYNTGTEKKLKLIVQHDTQRYIYNLNSEARYVSFPLQMGDGNYSISIYENTSGTKYRKVYATSGTLDLEDQNVVYLNSIQQVEWTGNDAAIAFANRLLYDYKLQKYGITSTYGTKYLPVNISLSDTEIIDLYYGWVVQNLKYDYDKIHTLKYDYIPDIDMILEARSGICYDYSVLLAAMLRSQGIHARLIKGYTSWTDVYHAWNEIYLEEADQWVIVDTTYDSYLYLRNRPYAFQKNSDVYLTSNLF